MEKNTILTTMVSWLKILFLPILMILVIQQLTTHRMTEAFSAADGLLFRMNLITSMHLEKD